MKRIINGKTYNTETATLIYENSFGEFTSDFNWWRESLYKTRSGEFFLYGEGGAGTKYAKALSSNSWVGGEEIRPLSKDEACQWLEDFESPDELCPELFLDAGAEEDIEPDAVIYLRVPSVLKNRLEAKAKSKGKSLNALLMRALEDI